MMLPSENVLDVLQCVDFATLLALQRAGSAFYDVVHCNRSILPRLRLFEFYLDCAMDVLKLHETDEDGWGTVLRLPEDEDLVPYSGEVDYSALRTVHDTVGTNFVESACIDSTLGPMQSRDFDMQKAVEALPALQHVRELMFDCRCLMHTSYDVDMELFERLILSPLDNLQSLQLDNLNSRTDWAFLRKDWALRLRSLTVEAFRPGHTEIDASGQAEILEYCTDFVHLEKGKPKIFTITGWRISPEFLQRIVMTVSKCKDWLTVVIGGTCGFTRDDADYVRSDVPREIDDFGGFVLYSSRDGSHRVFVQTLYGKIAVTNNPFVTTWRDTYKWDVEGF